MRRAAIVASITAATVGIAGAYYLRDAAEHHRLELKAYLQDAQGLRPGAVVQIAGVTVGEVKQVRVRPEVGGNPAEAILVVSTPYELKIPNDATVCLAKEGLLGGTMVQIRIDGASGSPATYGSTLQPGCK